MVLDDVWLRESGQFRSLRTGSTTPATDDPAVLPYWGAPTFRDEFDGASIDGAKWNVWDHSTHGSLSYDWGYLDADAASIVNGQLRQRMVKRTSAITASSKTRWWDTAYMTTLGKFEQTYGRWEMRAQIPTNAGISQGVWPAFWLRNGDVGEIDIMESWGDPPRNRTRNVNLTETSTHTIHQSTNGGGDSYGVTAEHRANGSSGTTAYDTAQGFHTWACEYTPTYLRFYFDDTLTADIRADGDRHAMAGANATRDFSWVFGTTFTSPWHVRINLQMGDPYWSSDDGTGVLTASSPADYLIDYFRGWAYPA